MINIEQLDVVLEAVREEYLNARMKHSPMHSAHEGYAVLKEEVDELWDDVKANRIELAKEEAVQVAAMAVAFILEPSM